jgi:hypothetical protein
MRENDHMPDGLDYEPAVCRALERLTAFFERHSDTIPPPSPEFYDLLRDTLHGLHAEAYIEGFDTARPMLEPTPGCNRCSQPWWRRLFAIR